MTTTYATLLSRSQILSNTVDDSEAEEVGKIALEEAMKFVASRVYIPSLHTSATYTWGADDTSVSITGVGGFNLSDFETSTLLFVNDIPYVKRDYLDWLQLKAIPAGQRLYLSQTATIDERPDRTFTEDLSGNILINPIAEDDEVTLIYRTAPTSYGTGTGSPELPDEFTGILVNAASVVLKEYVREPDQILDYYTLLESTLKQPIADLQRRLDSRRSKRQIKLAPSYRIPR